LACGRVFHVEKVDPDEVWVCGFVSICLPSSMKAISAKRFANGQPPTVAFESGLELSLAGHEAFRSCSHLASIRVLRSVEKLANYCSADWKSLWVVTFDPDSQLS
jgi:hypothetical protein